MVTMGPAELRGEQLFAQALNAHAKQRGVETMLQAARKAPREEQGAFMRGAVVAACALLEAACPPNPAIREGFVERMRRRAKREGVECSDEVLAWVRGVRALRHAIVHSGLPSPPEEEWIRQAGLPAITAHLDASMADAFEERLMQARMVIFQANVRAIGRRAQAGPFVADHDEGPDCFPA